MARARYGTEHRLHGRRLKPPSPKTNGTGPYLSLHEAVRFVGASRVAVVELLRFWGIPHTHIPVSLIEAHLTELTETSRRRSLTQSEHEAYCAWRARFTPPAFTDEDDQ